MFLVKRFVGLRVLYIYSFAFGLVELGKCTRIRGQVYGFFWKMTSGIPYSVLLGSTVVTRCVSL